MTHRMQETADAVVLAPAAPASASVIWLHGLGADGNDFVPIVPELRLPATPGIRFIFPHAPVRPVTLNMGMRMRAWYDIKTLTAEGRVDEAGLNESVGLLGGLIAAERALDISASRIVVAGFSQGGAVTLQTGLRYPKKLAGMMALSTYLPLPDSLGQEAAPANKQTPIFMAHGVHDGVIPLVMGAGSMTLLTGMGHPVEWHQYPMQHSVCAEEIGDIGAWLRKILKA